MSEFLGKTNSLVTFRNSQGVEARGTLLKLSRTTIVLEIYNPYSIVQLSEVLEGLVVRRGERVIYEGRAVISNLVNTGLMLIASATLVDSWKDLSGLLEDKEALRTEVEQFIDEWQEARQLRPGYRLAVGELRAFLSELSRWLEQVDMEVQSEELQGKLQLEQATFEELVNPLIQELSVLSGKFELEASQVPKDELILHKRFAQRDLHPLVMRSPFVYRTFHKPLGYAGDYEMVNMMLRDPREGPTTYAELINSLNVNMGPAKAHRNRIDILVDYLTKETKKAIENDVRLNVFDIGCGPAMEIQRFIAENPDSDHCNFRLMDFSDETLEYTRNKITGKIADSGRKTGLEMVHESVHALLKKTAENSESDLLDKFDFVYCAGLFDYLSDKVCTRLIRLFYKWTRPGGVLVLTNVHPSNTALNWMEHILEWYLIYRDEEHLLSLVPGLGEQRVYTDETGINVFLEIAKPS